MKNLIFTLLLFIGLNAFSKGKLLFVSNIEGTIQVDGMLKKNAKANEYYTFSLISGSHSVEFFYQNQRVLDTIVQIIDNNQSSIKLNFLLPNSSQVIEKDISLPPNNTNIFYSDSLNIESQSNIPVQIWFSFASYTTQANLLHSKNKAYFSQKAFSCDSGLTFKIEAGKSSNKVGKIVNQIENTVFNNSNLSANYFECINFETKEVIYRTNVSLDEITSFEFSIPKNGNYIFRTVCKDYLEKLDFTLSTNKKISGLMNSSIQPKENKELILAQKLEVEYYKKELFIVDLPENTKTWNYFVSSQKDLIVDEVLKGIASYKIDPNIRESGAFDSYYNQRFINGTGTIDYQTRRSSVLVNNEPINPVKAQMSVALVLNKPKDKIAPFYVYVVANTEVLE